MLLIKLLTKVNSFKNVQAVGGFSIFNQLSKGIDNERGDYTMDKKIIITKTAPEPIGPYSQAVVVERNVYVSGCLGINLETGKLVDGGVKQQAETALTHLKNILRASGSTMNNVVKTTVFLQDFNDFPIVNEIYKEAFVRNFPARSCVQVAKLPMGALVEIEAIAFIAEVKKNI